VNDTLLEGMKVVGELFGSGQMQLPFVLQSAEDRGPGTPVLRTGGDLVSRGPGLRPVGQGPLRSPALVLPAPPPGLEARFAGLAGSGVAGGVCCGLPAAPGQGAKYQQ
ncbi:B12-binding domain-containing protein, partial [Streptomyces sp. NPDC097981]|uniref:B12-binding domain-containing protein n=1 Tax=Streptomyces sp. NPDC097981 TaxID=3155428 RepID=UPI00331C4D1D